MHVVFNTDISKNTCIGFVHGMIVRDRVQTVGIVRSRTCVKNTGGRQSKSSMCTSSEA